LGVVNDTANEVQGSFRQASVTVTGKLVYTVFPVRHVNVHAGTVVANDRLRHESNGFAVCVSHVVDNVLQHLHFVRFLNQGVETHADFVLTGVGHFVVVNFYVQTNGFQGVTHGRTDVVVAVNRRHREVTAVHARTVAHVAAFHHRFSVPGCFRRVDFAEGTGHIRAPAHVVKHEEFRLRTKECGVTQTSRLQVLFSATGHGTRITVVTLHGGRFDDVAAQHQGGVFSDGGQEAVRVIRHQDHVGRFNALPAGNRRTDEHLAGFEEVFDYITGRNGDVLLFTFGIGETQVNPLHVVFFDQIQSFL